MRNLTAFLILGNLLYCSNFSFKPLSITGEDAFNRIKLSFVEINVINPAMYSFPLLLNPKQTLTEKDIQPIVLTGMYLSTTSAENLTKTIVNRKKWYNESEVNACAASIRRVGLLMNLLTFNNAFTSTSSIQSLFSFAAIPRTAASSCRLQPVPDLFIIRTGTEGKAEDDD